MDAQTCVGTSKRRVMLSHYMLTTKGAWHGFVCSAGSLGNNLFDEDDGGVLVRNIETDV